MLLVIAGMLIFSGYYLYDALMSSIEEGDMTNSGFNILLGMIGLSVTVYLATQLFRKPRAKKDPPKLLTTLECSVCGLKNIRSFTRSDHIFKTAEMCQKCEKHMLITAIYTEDEKK